MQRIKKLIKYLLCMLTVGCLSKNEDHSELWKTIFEYQNDFRKEHRLSGKFDVLYGSLRPDTENLGHQKDGGFLLAGSIKRTSAERVAELHEREKISPDEVYHTVSYFRKSEYGGGKTYKIRRKTYIPSIPIFTIQNFLNWLEDFVQLISAEEEPDPFLKKSPLYNYLRANYECSIVKSGDSRTLQFQLHERIAKIDSGYYDRMKRFMKFVEFRTEIFFGNEKVKVVEIENNSNSFMVNFVRTKKNLIRDSATILFRTDMRVSFYGLKININNIGYRVKIERKKNEINFSGAYTSTPLHKISGKLLYFLPAGLVKAFIPGNIDEYFRNYFHLLVSGYDSEGARFFTNCVIKKNRMDVFYESEQEVFQKPFRFSGGSDNKISESSRFMRELENKIVEEMK
ncbi:MAG: hypothetical protein K8R21_11345 [Leptospira sp.]|nr:hypothetical protein [Leptospira sp.]